MGSDLSHRSEEAFASTKLLRHRSWFVDDCMVSEREDLFTHYAGQDERIGRLVSKVQIS